MRGKVRKRGEMRVIGEGEEEKRKKKMRGRRKEEEKRKKKMRGRRKEETCTIPAMPLAHVGRLQRGRKEDKSRT